MLFDFSLFEKIDQINCIKLCVKNEIKSASTVLTEAFDESTNSRAQVQLLYNRFQEARKDIKDGAHHCGRPSTSTTNKNIEAEKKMILNCPRITIREVADNVAISLS